MASHSESTGSSLTAHRTRMLWLAGALHGFTHVYQVALLPLYFRIQQEFGLRNIGSATFLLTVMMAAYFLPSYPMGMLADRVSRKRLLTAGLLINALGYVALGLAPTYGWAVAAAIMTGFGGSFYHPAATAMVARLCPVGTGRALGIVGIGASIGFFLGPLYAGWRADVSGWRAPLIELGLFGVVGALFFQWFADEEMRSELRETKRVAPKSLFPVPLLLVFFIGACFAFSLRDFAGSSMGTVGSLFLQKAHGFSMRRTGMALSAIFIASAISNPLFGSLSDRGRIRWSCFVLLLAAALIALFPRLLTSLLVPAYLLYGFFFMASYPVIEAALMESVPDAVRGRVFGLFITVGGLIGNLSHWIVGRWVEGLGPAAYSPPAYYVIYNTLAGFILVSLIGLPCLHAIRRREQKESARMAAAAPARAVV